MEVGGEERCNVQLIIFLVICLTLAATHATTRSRPFRRRHPRPPRPRPPRRRPPRLGSAAVAVAAVRQSVLTMGKPLRGTIFQRNPMKGEDNYKFNSGSNLRPPGDATNVDLLPPPNDSDGHPTLAYAFTVKSCCFFPSIFSCFVRCP